MTIITNKQKEDFTQNLSLEIGDDLANKFSTSLFAESNDNLQSAIKLYYNIGKLWTPTLMHWKNWIQTNMKYKPFLIMRDAKPLTVLSESENWDKLYLNRDNCGISDELAHLKANGISQTVLGYMEQKELLRQSF